MNWLTFQRYIDKYQKRNRKAIRMKSFTYTIKEELGLHARPAGLVMKLAKNYSSSIILRTEKNKSADMKKLIALMGLCVKQGDTVTVTIEGEDEEAAWNEMNDFFLANL